MLKNTAGEIRVYYCVFIKKYGNPHAVVRILVNGVTQNYPADNTNPTYIDRRIARELFIILEKHVSGGMDMSEGQTLWCDSDRTSDALSEDNDVLGSKVHNTATGSSSYEPSPLTVKRKSIYEQFSKIAMQRNYDSVKIVKKNVAATARKFKISPGKVRQIVKALERCGTIENRHVLIREHMYTKFSNARNIGNAINYCT